MGQRSIIVLLGVLFEQEEKDPVWDICLFPFNFHCSFALTKIFFLIPTDSHKGILIALFFLCSELQLYL